MPDYIRQKIRNAGGSPEIIDTAAISSVHGYSQGNPRLIDNVIDEETAQKCTWVSQFIMEYYGSGTGQSLIDPLHTVVTKDRFALITVLGNEFVLLDICLRMLTPEELKRGQGFPNDYIIDRDYRWRKYPVSKQVARIGNSVVPIMAENACTELKLTAEQQNLPVAVPGYIGCGLAGGNWEFVYSDILVPTFKDFRPGFTIVYDMRAIKNLWSDFGNVPMDPETERIEQKWHEFKPGTHREEIWHWFEKTFDLSVTEDLMNI